jgi:hypothetical protein
MFAERDCAFLETAGGEHVYVSRNAVAGGGFGQRATPPEGWPVTGAVSAPNWTRAVALRAVSGKVESRQGDGFRCALPILRVGAHGLPQDG